MEQDIYEEYFKQHNEGKNTDAFKNTNFEQFKRNRHKIKTDAERRAENEAKYQKYMPNEDSNFHKNNRHFLDFDHTKWRFLTTNPFEIRDKNEKVDNCFDNAQQQFDKKEKESMTRKALKDEEVLKMFKPKAVIAVFLGLVTLKQGVNIYVT